MQDNLSLYHIFYTVARTGSISHSSRDLYISQPAISKESRSWSRIWIPFFLNEVPGVSL